jgi:hypothetical protein
MTTFDEVRKGAGIQLCGTCLTTYSAMALFFVLVAWLAGGDQFKDSIFGNASIAVFLAGIAAGIVMTTVARHRRRD